MTVACVRGRRECDGGFSDRDQPRDPLGAGGRVPEREHAAERVADDGRVVEFERVEDVVDQLARGLADVTALIGGRVREPVAGKVDREQPVARERGE